MTLPHSPLGHTRLQPLAPPMLTTCLPHHAGRLPGAAVRFCGNLMEAAPPRGDGHYTNQMVHNTQHLLATGCNS